MADRLEAYREAITSAAAAGVPPDVEIEFRKMFGGMAAYARGRVFSLTSPGGIALKLSEEDRQELLAVEGAKYLQYESDPAPSKQYIDLPPQIHNDPAALAGWVARSVNYALTLPLPKRKPRRKSGQT